MLSLHEIRKWVMNKISHYIPLDEAVKRITASDLYDVAGHTEMWEELGVTRYEYYRSMLILELPLYGFRAQSNIFEEISRSSIWGFDKDNNIIIEPVEVSYEKTDDEFYQYHCDGWIKKYTGTITHTNLCFKSRHVNNLLKRVKKDKKIFLQKRKNSGFVKYKRTTIYKILLTNYLKRKYKSCVKGFYYLKHKILKIRVKEKKVEIWGTSKFYKDFDD
jgi:triacylglycerol esterase/lipase EstA (alpha/beta hydrolase family)